MKTNKLIIKNVELSATTIDFINNDFKKDFILTINDDNHIVIDFFTDIENNFGVKIDENIIRNWLINCQHEINGIVKPVYNDFKIKRRKNIFNSLLNNKNEDKD